MLRASDFADESWPLARWPRKAGRAIAARMPMIRMTTRSSIRVKPFSLSIRSRNFRSIELLLSGADWYLTVASRRGKPPELGPGGGPAGSQESPVDFASPPHDGFAFTPWPWLITRSTPPHGSFRNCEEVQLVHTSRVASVHLRRALLLFAMVLGFAALAAAVSRTSRLDQTDRGAAPSPPPSGEVRPPEEVELSAKGRPRTARVAADDSTVLSASVDEPGQ